MFLRKCPVCHCPMDPGEGKNGICEDCITGETGRRQREKELEHMIHTKKYKQMELEEFLK